MTNYVKITDFAGKDSLTTGNPDKIIKGTEINDELNSIQTAIGTKADLASPNFLGNPTAPTQSLGNNSTRIATTAFVLNNAIPSGGIIMWAGTVAAIPLGWALCNGSNGTPDLRNKFIIAANSDNAAQAQTNITGTFTKTGGSKDAILVSHTHTASTNTVGDHTHGTRINDEAGVDFDYFGEGARDKNNTASGFPTGPAGAHSHTVTVSTEGSSGTNANLPPYFALAYIMKL